MTTRVADVKGEFGFGSVGIMFAGCDIVASSRLTQDVIEALRDGGCSDIRSTITANAAPHWVVVDSGEPVYAVARSAVGMRRLRALQIPVYTAEWVRQSSAAGRQITLPEARLRDQKRDAATREVALLKYDPQCLSACVFTTSDLPLQLRNNVQDTVVFYGGTFNTALLTSTTHIVVPSNCASPKLEAARHARVRVVGLTWLQQVIDTGLLPRLDAADRRLSSPPAQSVSRVLDLSPAADVNAPISPASTRTSLALDDLIADRLFEDGTLEHTPMARSRLNRHRTEAALGSTLEALRNAREEESIANRLRHRKRTSTQITG
jgi:hypothetical protein